MANHNPLGILGNPYQTVLNTAHYRSTGSTTAPRVTKDELDRFIEELDGAAQSTQGDSQLYWQQQLDAALFLSSNFDMLAGADGDESTLSLEDIAAMQTGNDPGIPGPGVRPRQDPPAGGGSQGGTLR